MKIVLATLALLIFYYPIFAQQKIADAATSEYDDCLGTYGNQIIATEKFIIKKEKNQLMLVIPGQGKTDLTLVAGNTFKVKLVRPAARIEFIKDSAGEAQQFLWHQNLNLQWSKVFDSAVSPPVARESLEEYTGKYKLNNLTTATVRMDNNHLIFEVSANNMMEVSRIDLLFLSTDKFTLTTKEANQVFEFTRNKSGVIQRINVTRNGPIMFRKLSRSVTDSSIATNFADRQNGFNRADSLRGMLMHMRACYDVKFYGLDVDINPDTRSIKGNTLIRFKATDSFSNMQVDLYANMKIEKILYHNDTLSYTREHNAVFLQFPTAIIKDSEQEISIIYSGSPQVPQMASLSGGFFWLHDKNGKPWIESVCQGAGASLWWPCKDHLSDKPDSMRISITVPAGLNEISNGRLKSKTNLPGNRTRFDWDVSYPINTYNVAVNIGDYTHFSDLYIKKEDTLTLDYYCLSYNADKAQTIFNHVKPMLALYEQHFGKYPFSLDGFTLLESLYPMEHQSAVTFGPINNPLNSDKFDSTDLIRTTWHEAAHEWWGNNITCSDNADLWIHEAFATYAEVLSYEISQGKEAAIKYLKSERPTNQKPIIGVYDVNDFHLGDMYSKGALMLHTLRNIINNDSLWFTILRGIQLDLKYKSVTTKDIVDYFSETTHQNLKPFFDQYLRYANIPQLSIRFKKKGKSLEVQYKWNADVAQFSMPVKVTTSKGHFEFIYPSSLWQTINLPGMKAKNFKVDRDGFYIKL